VKPLDQTLVLPPKKPGKRSLIRIEADKEVKWLLFLIVRALLAPLPARMMDRRVPVTMLCQPIPASMSGTNRLVPFVLVSVLVWFISMVLYVLGLSEQLALPCLLPWASPPLSPLPVSVVNC
jgi:hypothetical protein